MLTNNFDRHKIALLRSLVRRKFPIVGELNHLALSNLDLLRRYLSVAYRIPKSFDRAPLQLRCSEQITRVRRHNDAGEAFSKEKTMRKTTTTGFVLSLLAGCGLSALTASPAAACSVTYSFSNGSTADATQVNQNFSDVIGCVGSPTFSGPVTTSGGYFQATNSGSAGIFTTTGASNAINAHVPSTSASYIVFYYDGSGGGAAGQVYPNSPTTVQYLTSSDERMKNFDVPQRDYRPIIDKLAVRDFTWRVDGHPGFGVSAQQAYPLYPQAIHKPRDDKENWQADYGQFAPLALWGVKDLYKTTTDQANQISKMHAEADTLRKKVAALEQTNSDQAVAFKRLEDQVGALARRSEVLTASN